MLLDVRKALHRPHLPVRRADLHNALTEPAPEVLRPRADGMTIELESGAGQMQVMVLLQVLGEVVLVAEARSALLDTVSVIECFPTDVDFGMGSVGGFFVSGPFVVGGVAVEAFGGVGAAVE